MRIFISNYNITKLTNYIPYLKKYLVERKKKLFITTSEGEYYIDNTNIYKVYVIDKEPVLYEKFYNDMNLLIDYSCETLIETNQIHNHSVEMLYTYYYFALNKASRLKLVIQAYGDDIDNLNNIRITDFYFETEKECEINNLFFRDEINVFLSLLN